MSIPKYRRIIADVVAKIESGELKSGDKLGSTSDLQIEYGVSLTVVNQAAIVLEAQGLIEGVAGVGRFVK